MPPKRFGHERIRNDLDINLLILPPEEQDIDISKLNIFIQTINKHLESLNVQIVKMELIAFYVDKVVAYKYIFATKKADDNVETILTEILSQYNKLLKDYDIQLLDTPSTSIQLKELGIKSDKKKNNKDTKKKNTKDAMPPKKLRDNEYVVKIEYNGNEPMKPDSILDKYQQNVSDEIFTYAFAPFSTYKYNKDSLIFMIEVRWGIKDGNLRDPIPGDVEKRIINTLKKYAAKIKEDYTIIFYSNPEDGTAVLAGKNKKGILIKGTHKQPSIYIKTYTDINLLIQPEDGNKLSINELNKFLESINDELDENNIFVIKKELIIYEKDKAAVYEYELGTNTENENTERLFSDIADKVNAKFAKDLEVSVFDKEGIDYILKSIGIKKGIKHISERVSPIKGNKDIKMPPKRGSPKKLLQNKSSPNKKPFSTYLVVLDLEDEDATPTQQENTVEEFMEALFHEVDEDKIKIQTNWMEGFDYDKQKIIPNSGITIVIYTHLVDESLTQAKVTAEVKRLVKASKDTLKGMYSYKIISDKKKVDAVLNVKTSPKKAKTPVKTKKTSVKKTSPKKRPAIPKKKLTQQEIMKLTEKLSLSGYDYASTEVYANGATVIVKFNRL